jgi:predicted GNAT family acetyltransferase
MSTLKVYASPADFLAETSELLQTDEARYGLIYGIARLTAVNPHHYGEVDPWFATVSDSEGISALAWRTPPHLVGLAWHAGNPEEAVPLLVKVVRERWAEIPGVAGHREVTDLFAEKWCEICGTSIKATMAQRIYRLDSVNEVPATPGRMRLATLEDKDLVSEWVRAFTAEAGGPTASSRPERDMTPFIDGGNIYLWENAGKPVSLTLKARPTKHSMAIGLVYTPPGHWRKGYATACVAAVCREILKSGYDFCTLYTDLSNPTSNSIYMKIGFSPVCDNVEHAFSKPAN